MEIDAAARAVPISFPIVAKATIGVSNTGGGSQDRADGFIDDVRLYDYELTAGEIAALAASQPSDCQ